MLNYLDDLCVVSTVKNSQEEFIKVTNLLETLGLSESEEKSVSPGSRVEFLGVLFDTNLQTMEVTEARLIEIRGLVTEWLSKSRANKRDLQSLIGKLVFISRCVYASRVFICRLLGTLRGLKSQKHRFKISGEFRKDLAWWDNFLVRYNGVTYIPDMVWASPDVVISTDACLTGAGGWSGTNYFSCKFPDSVVKRNFHINVLELLAILVALRLWSGRCSGLRFQIFCDNEVSVTIINSGRCRDSALLGILREILFICAVENIQIKAVHLPGVSNRISDYLSRSPSNPKIDLKEVIGADWARFEVSEDLFQIRDVW